jgi:uncharacterized protein YndB with AHSA1/START domain
MSNPDSSILKVRRSIHVMAPPERVWAAFTSFEQMDRWWGAKRGTPIAGQPQGQWLIAYEPRVGGRIEMAVDMQGSRAHYGGVIEVFAANRELSFSNDWKPNQGWAKPTYMTVRLSPAFGGTLVELFHHGFEHTGGDISGEHAGYEEGWGMLQLTSLKALAEHP